ncbi:hypothetical protein DFH09DRAFT_1216514 [Mycena vulgaris]|nr:hypothetical protein DFH09DRAFT_1216514 [Mycena vulgaris]
MDELSFPGLYWDDSSEAQRSTVAQGSSAPAPDVMSAFEFPADSGLPSAMATPFIYVTHFGRPTPVATFHSDFPVADSWDATLLPLLPSQPSVTWDHNVQPQWEDFISSLQPMPARAPSTDSSSAGDFFHDGYGDEYSSSRFSSAPPFSVPEDDGWFSRGWSSKNSRPVSAAPSSVYGDLDDNSPPSVSVQIEPWDTAFDKAG